MFTGPAARKTYDAEYYQRNREKRLSQVKQWAAENPDRRLNNLLKSAYGLSVEEYKLAVEAQGGLCAICNKAPSKGRLVVDHNHATDAVRALLCITCNSMLGVSYDNPDTLRRGAEYLEKHGSYGTSGA